MKRVSTTFLFLVVLFSMNAQAFRFSPFRAKFEPSGTRANNTFLIENNTGEPTSVQIRVTSREVDVNGVEKNQDDEKDFRVYPAQMILKPHAKRSVRVQWVGDTNLKTERAFRIVAEQLPVNLDKKHTKKSAVKFLVTYRGVLFVTPKSLSPDVKLKSFATRDDNGKKKLELVFNNTGGQHALLQNLKLNVKDSKGEIVTLAGEKELPGLTGEGILSEHERKFLILWPDRLASAPTQIDFTFDKQSF